MALSGASGCRILVHAHLVQLIKVNFGNLMVYAWFLFFYLDGYICFLLQEVVRRQQTSPGRLLPPHMTQ